MTSLLKQKNYLTIKLQIMIPIIIIRILFAACMVFIIGYVFGGFSKNRSLKTITKIAAILVIVLFVAVNGLFMRSYFGHGRFRGMHYWNRCDSTQVQQKQIP
jgi:hypothetical protein